MFESFNLGTARVKFVKSDGDNLDHGWVYSANWIYAFKCAKISRAIRNWSNGPFIALINMKSSMKNSHKRPIFSNLFSSFFHSFLINRNVKFQLIDEIVLLVAEKLYEIQWFNNWKLKMHIWIAHLACFHMWFSFFRSLFTKLVDSITKPTS